MAGGVAGGFLLMVGMRVQGKRDGIKVIRRVGSCGGLGRVE